MFPSKHFSALCDSISLMSVLHINAQKCVTFVQRLSMPPCFLLLHFSSSCLQPSIYLRLLENPSAVSQQTSFLFSPKSPPSLSQSSYSCSLSPSRCQSPSHSPSPKVTEHYCPERSSPDLTTSHFSASYMSASEINHSSERSEKLTQKVNLTL